MSETYDALMRRAGQVVELTDWQIFELIQKSQSVARRVDQVMNMPEGTQFFRAEFDGWTGAMCQQELTREEALKAAKWGDVIGFNPFRNASGQTAPFGRPRPLGFELIEKTYVYEVAEEPPPVPSDGKRHLDLEPIADIAQPKVTTREIDL